MFDGSGLVFDVVEGRESVDLEFGMGIDAEGGEDGGEEVLLVEGILDDFSAVFIGGTDEGSALDAAAGHGEGPGVRVVVAAAGLVDPGGTAELAHGDDQGVFKHAAVFEVFGELEDDVVEIGNDHLVDLVVEDVGVPRHAIGDHDEGGSFLDKGAGEEGVLAKGSGAVAVAVGLRDALEIEKVGATHEAVDAFEGGVPGTGGGGFAIILVFLAEELAEGFARFVIVFGDGVELVGVGDLKLAADTDGGVFRTEPTGPVSRFEAFEFVALGAGIKENEVGDF